MRVPPTALSNRQTHVMLALLSGCNTISKVHEAVGFGCRDATWRALRSLETAGLATHDVDRQGTWAATVDVVACEPSMWKVRSDG